MKKQMFLGASKLIFERAKELRKKPDAVGIGFVGLFKAKPFWP
jgi:hypothetical protein